jgi:hypothetical protein
MDSNTKLHPPFFIIGSGRSGTTMLRLMLNRHSALRIPRESGFIIPLLDELPTHGTLSNAQRERAFEIIRSHYRWKDWECDDGLLKDAVCYSADPTLAGTIDSVFRRCCGMDTAIRWGDKTPRYSLCAVELNELFPDAIFFHMMRDARDVYLSMRKAGWFGASARRIGKYWNSTTQSALLLRKISPGRYFEIHYENLVNEPERELCNICNALGLSFEPAMLTFFETALKETAPWEVGLHSKTRRSPNPTEDLHRWKRELSVYQVFLIESVVSKTMLEVGQTPAFGAQWAPAQALVRGFFKFQDWMIDWKVRIKNRLT